MRISDWSSDVCSSDLAALVCCLRNTQTESTHGIEDLISRFCPNKGVGILVVSIKVLSNGLFKRPSAAMGTASDLFACDLGKPSLNLIDPGSRGGREVHMKTGVTRQPVLDRSRLMGAVVVHHQMHVQLAGHVSLDGAQELYKFTAAEIGSAHV